MSSISNLTTTDGPNWETSDNHSPLVNVLTWFLVITTFFAVAARVATRFAVVRQLRWDDATILIAMVIIWLLDRLRATADMDRTRYCRLRILSPRLCRLQTDWADIRVRPLHTRLKTSKSVTSFWASYHILNILTDLGLIALPWIILLGLQVQVKRKAVIIACFSARILCVIVTIVQIYYLFSRTVGTHDLPFDLWLVALMGEVVIALSIITACIPYLKPFMEALETGMIAAGGVVVTSSQAQSPSAYGYYRQNSTSNVKKFGNMSKKGSRTQLATDPGVRMDNFGYAVTAGCAERDYDRRDQSTAHTIIESKGHRGGRDSDTESQGSQSRIIRKTVGWSVTEEPHSPSS
ncbi:MAG: hypothetical protein Q9220_006081 [cf. Caloplaca sp. 1 TL-2023]